MASEQSGAAEVVQLRDDTDKAVLFISHRHEDVAVADALRRFVDARTGGRVRVFQSSSSDAEGPKQGQNITAELRRALWHANVVVLIYTTPDHDWSYCMWECGVAQLPEPSDTRIIVFQCAEHVPPVFADQLRVEVKNELDIEKFVTDLLTDEQYFPKLGEAVTAFRPGTEPVKEAARDLHGRVQQLVDIADTVEEWPPYPQMTLELRDEHTERMRLAEGSSAERLDVARPIVVDAAVVIGGDSQVGRIFGVPGFPRTPLVPGVPLSQLVSSWQHDTATPGSRWVDAICTQMMAAVRGQFPTLRWELMRGVDELDLTWYGPVLRYYKKIARRRCTEFDVVFCKFQLDADGRPKIGVPDVEDEV
ncbi:MAG: toll/interleukin-1 receptor domain-containing protein [Actinomycetota bacterium]|nr:toll/interleukin-1 receptor domain-containing protein [Actinomycetota bacterium]